MSLLRQQARAVSLTAGSPSQQLVFTNEVQLYRGDVVEWANAIEGFISLDVTATLLVEYSDDGSNYTTLFTRALAAGVTPVSFVPFAQLTRITVTRLAADATLTYELKQVSRHGSSALLHSTRIEPSAFGWTAEENVNAAATLSSPVFDISGGLHPDTAGPPAGGVTWEGRVRASRILIFARSNSGAYTINLYEGRRSGSLLQTQSQAVATVAAQKFTFDIAATFCRVDFVQGGGASGTAILDVRLEAGPRGV